MIKRPLGIVAVLYACGVLLGNYFSLPLSCLIPITIVLIVGLVIVSKLRLPIFWILFLFLGWTNFTWHTAVLSPTDLRRLLSDEPALVTIRGTLAETPTQRLYLTDEGETLRTTARLRVKEIQRGTNWQPATGQIIITTPSELPEKFCQHQQVQIYGVIAPPPIPIAEGLFDYREYLRRQEIYFQLKTQSSNDWQTIGATVSPPLSDRFTRWAKSALTLGRTNIDTPLRLEQALTIGDKSFLTDDVTEPFMQAATFHIFAVDGLRMAILFGIFFKTLRWLRVPRTISGLVLIPLLWFYVDLTGWPASAIRAAVMLTIVIGGWMLKRPIDVLNSLCAAALVILVWQPQQLFQAGFQLSFFVVLCIFLVMPKFDELIQRLLRCDPMLPEKLRPQWQIALLKPLRWILDLAFSSFAAWLGSLPLAAYYFHILNPVSTPANILAVPLCGLVLICNSLSLLLAAWLPAAAAIFNLLGWHFMHWIHATSIWFAKWPLAYFYVPAPSLFNILLFYAIFIATATGWLFKPDWRKSKFTAVALLLSISCVQWLHDHSITQLTVIPLNGGSAVYLDAPGFKNDLLLDCGNEDSVNFVMKPYLRAQGVNSLPAVALSAGDIQQIGGFPKLQTLFPVKTVFTSPVQFRSPAYREIIHSLDATPNLRQPVSPGDQFQNWTVLFPGDTNYFPRADDNALVLRGEIRGTKIILLSALGKPGQDALLDRHTDLRADIVITGLPNQTEPLGDSLLEAIHPKLIIIADSQSPATHRANHTLRARLEKQDVPVLYTSDLGAIKMSLRQNLWKAETVNRTTWRGTPLTATPR